MRNYIFLLFIIFLLNSCQKTIEFKDFRYGDFLIIKKGSKLIQGKEYEFYWNTKGLNSNKFYCEILFHYEKDGNYEPRIIRLQKIDSNLYKGVLKIPYRTSWVYLALSTPYSSLSCPYSIRLPVFKDELTPEYGANSVALMNSNKDNYLKSFYSERELYPENYSIYVVRWRYEIEKKIFAKDTIMKNLREIERKGNTPEILIVKLIGNSIIMNYSMHNTILKDLCQRLKFSSLMNNWETAGLFSQMLAKNFAKDSNIKKLIDTIVKYNPYSYFTETLIRRGILTRKEYTDPATALNVLNKLIQKDSSYWLFPHKATVLTFNYLPDSLTQLEILVKKMLNAYKNYTNDDETYFKLKDYHHAFYMVPGLLPSILRQLAFATEKYETYINYSKELAENLGANLTAKGVFYINLGETYEKIQKNDSALKYYFYSFSLLPNLTQTYEKIKSITKQTEDIKVNRIISFLRKKYGFPLTKIIDLPPITYINGEKEDIRHLHRPKIIFFYSTKCGVCKRVFSDLAKYKPLIEKKSIKIYFISPEAIKELENLWIYKFFGTNVVTNGSLIKSSLGIGDGFPQIILINSNNYIVNWFNGYSEGTDWRQILKYLN